MGVRAGGVEEGDRGKIECCIILSMDSFEILTEVTEIEVIAVGNSIRDLARLRKTYGDGRWRKLKGIATIRLRDGSVHRAELHWYESSGIGRKEFKRKRYLD